MSTISFNEKEMIDITNEAKNFIRVLQKEIINLQNLEADPFDRYFAAVTMKELLIAGAGLYEQIKRCLSHGHTINHSFLNTQKAKNCGWGNEAINLNENDFFVNETKSDDKENLKKFIDALEAFIKKGGAND